MRKSPFARLSGNRFVYVASSVAALAGLLFGYDTGVISGAILFVKTEFNLSSSLQELVVSAVLVGAIIGAAVSGSLADRYGRRGVIVVAAIIFALGAIGTALAPDVDLLIAGRIVVGLAIGAASFVGPLFIAELAPARYRGRLVSINQLALTSGIVIAYLVDYAFSPVAGWRYMFGLAAIPAIILGVAMYLLPDSPRWLLSRGRVKEARIILRQIRGTREVNGELSSIRQSLQTETGGWRDLFSPLIRPALIVGIGLAVLQQVTGINTVIYYAPTIFQFAGFQEAGFAILASLAVGVTNVLLTVVAIFLIDRVGRRPLLLISLTGMTLSLVALGFTFALGSLGSEVGLFAIISLVLYVGFFAVGMGPIFWLMISEVFPLKARGRAMSTATVANWGANLLVSITFLTLVGALGKSGTFWLYAIIGVLAVAFVYFLVPETKGKTLEQIQAHWRAGRHPRELGKAQPERPLRAGAPPSGGPAPPQRSQQGRPATSQGGGKGSAPPPRGGHGDPAAPQEGDHQAPAPSQGGDHRAPAPSQAGDHDGSAPQPGGERGARTPSPEGQQGGRAPGEQPKASTPELLQRLHASPQGLTQAEAQQRLTQYGYNEITEKRVSPLRRLLSYFWGPIPWMIEVAAILSAVLRDVTTVIVILVLLFMNALVGFWEESQASNAVEALKKSLALKARARRDGNWVTIAARELVPGDVIHVRLGDVVPADARLLEGQPLEVDQSALTGESLPVTHKPGDDVYSGSVVRQGEEDALVTGTGTHTFFGRTTELVAGTHVVSHFQRAVMRVADYLIILALALVAVILIVAIVRRTNLATAIEFVLVLTVASIPVAMPTVLSVTMALGARVLAKQQAIVTRLASVEELAGVDILCADKTGTLTQNKLTLGDAAVLQAKDPQEVILAAALASRSEGEDPIDMAVLGATKPEQTKGYEVQHFEPFDPVRKRTEATVKAPDGHVFWVSKGAPQVILDLATDKGQIETKVNEAVEGFAKRGFRSLGVARADKEGAWQYLGILPLYDPPRPDSRDTIAGMRQMGIQLKMITGDQIAIAKEIARQLGLGLNILEAKVFRQAQPHQSTQLADTIEQADGFAEVFPEDKYNIVSSLQSRGHIVGMTGDGVNDAPPLKRADAGIAVSGATDAARAAADIVLLAPGLSVIIEAFRESRRVFRRMNSYTIYRVAETVALVFFVTLSILIFDFFPVTAIMIVLLAVLNDGAILSIAYDRARYANKPEKWDMRLVLTVATVLGAYGLAESFVFLSLALNVYHIDRAIIPSLVYLQLSVSGHLTIFVTRNRGAFFSYRPAWILVFAVVGTQLLATLITVYGLLVPPIGWLLALDVWVYCLVLFILQDGVKLAAYRILDLEERGVLASRHPWESGARPRVEAGRARPEAQQGRGGPQGPPAQPEHEAQPGQQAQPERQAQPEHAAQPERQAQPQPARQPEHAKQPEHEEQPQREAQPQPAKQPEHEEQPQREAQPERQEQPQHEAQPEHEAQPQQEEPEKERQR